ncbi:MAG: hypothetical protein M1829_002015 [Trizodia sp. TS-e1964]|nr:MAG: hypothetical protein M1829_002015 [Trizodia sp. TS-e1964]
MHLTRALSSLAPLQTHTLPAPICGHIAVLTLSRPSSQNALNLPLATALHTHLAALHAECAARPPAARARALILASSTPGVFCAGADLRERAGLSLDQQVSRPLLLLVNLTDENQDTPFLADATRRPGVAGWIADPDFRCD